MASLKVFFPIAGERYGMLVMVKRIDDLDTIPEYVPLSYLACGAIWECDCDCGQKAYYPDKILSRGVVKSCGCLRYGRIIKAQKRRGKIQEVRDLRKIIKKLMYDLAVIRASGQMDNLGETVAKPLREARARLRALGYTK